MNVTTVDFETHGILKRPNFPPEPVGVAVMEDGVSSYYAWGHPTNNNCTRAEGIAVLKRIWSHAGRNPICFHNAKFDIAVAHEKLGLPLLKWHEFHDTMLLAFLINPFEEQIGLKPLAEKYLGLPPDEQDEVKDWIMANIKTEKGTKPGKDWGKYIALAPGDLVGEYAKGDVLRTCDLYHAFKLISQERDMLAAYNRERQLLPILAKTERAGIMVDHARMSEDYEDAQERFTSVSNALLTRLGDIDIDSGDQLADSLELEGLVNPDDWAYTQKGVRKTGYKEIAKICTDTSISRALEYRGKMATITRTFMKPWLEMSTDTGRIYTDWQQVRNGEGRVYGARTGRLSSTPNFQNVPKMPWEVDGFDPLPYMRQYIIAEPGCVLIDRDYSQQELRLLAHYIGGELVAAYQADPHLDLHAFAQTTINNMLKANYGRKPIKNTAFAILYGMANGSLAEMLGTDKRKAATLKGAYLKVMPGLNALIKVLKNRAKRGESFRTWGGRHYYCEEPKLVNGRRMTFEYKMLNQLIQGSAADTTKEAVIRMDAVCESPLLLTVHDQILRNSPEEMMVSEMRSMKEAMESIECDVPMLSDGEWSPTNWGELRAYDDERAGKCDRGNGVQICQAQEHTDDKDEFTGPPRLPGQNDAGAERQSTVH